MQDPCLIIWSITTGALQILCDPQSLFFNIPNNA